MEKADEIDDLETQLRVEDMILRSKPNDHHEHYQKGRLLSQLFDLTGDNNYVQRALESFNTATTIYKSDPGYFVDLGKLYAKLGDGPKAIYNISRADELLPKNQADIEALSEKQKIIVYYVRNTKEVRQNNIYFTK